jgi:transaldolase
MKIFAATSDVDAIQWADQAGLIDGVLVTSDHPDDTERVCRASVLPVLVSLAAASSDVLRMFGDQMSVQVPFREDGLGTMRQLRADAVRIVATRVSTAAQAVLAAKAGASMVSVDVDHLDRLGRDGAEVVRDVRALFDQHGTSCDVLAALPRDAAQFARCARAGADVIAVEPDLLHALLVSAVP